MSQNQPAPLAADVPLFHDDDRVAIAAARWNADIVDKLLAGCDGRLRELGAGVELYRVPGAYELPTAAKWLAESKQFVAVVCVGCVIRGDTPHFEYVAGECARGLMNVSISTGVPVIFGVLTVNTHEQAIERTGGAHGHAGIAAANAAAEMAALNRQISISASPVTSHPAARLIEIEQQMADQLRTEDADRRGPTGKSAPIPIVED